MINDMVKLAIEQHREWHKQALPSAKHEPRVMVSDGSKTVLRRPFKSKGHWRVRWAGTARIVNPQMVDGNILFTADWSKPRCAEIL